MKGSRFISKSGRLTCLQYSVLTFCIAAYTPVLATTLDKASCDKLTESMQNLKALDVDKLMERGPSWALSHLSPGDLNLVRQYIDLDEQLKFRCSAPSSLVHLKHLDDEDEDGAKAAAEASEKSGDAASDADGADKGKKASKGAKKAKRAAQPDSGDRN